ncbi:MAG: FGGY-family carbohydrate kinase, partial [Candidatus Atribacteria bacterium]|nr:FGGY-family carbohydrate kinase [Candidatus Atribacteria bacterium]
AGKGTPELDSTRQGIIFGLTCESSSRDILKALLESLCFETRRNLDFLEKNLSVNFGEVRVVGGGSRSHYFSRLKSTIYGKKIVFFDFPDLSAFGAAVLAMAGVEGWGKALGVLDHFQEKARIFEYSSENKSIYEQKYHHYLALGQTLDRCLMDYSFLISKETF